MRAALRISVLSAMLSFTLGFATVVHAQEASEPTPAQVRIAAEAFDKGREAYQDEDYVEAAEQFEKADYNAPSPAAIELAARSRDKAGELDRAATLAAFGLKRHPNDRNLGKLAADLTKRASATLFELTATCDNPCDLTVRGKLIHGAPDTNRTLYVAPGALTVRAGWSENRNDSKQIDAEAGERGAVNFVAPALRAAESIAQEKPDAAPVEHTAPEPEPDDAAKKGSGWSPAVFYTGLGLTVALAGVTVWSGLDTVNNPGADRVKEECGALMQQEDCALYQEGVGKQNRTNILIGVTAGVGVVTALIAALGTDWSGGKSSPQESAKLLRPRVNVAPWASLDGGGVQAVGRF